MSYKEKIGMLTEALPGTISRLALDETDRAVLEAALEVIRAENARLAKIGRRRKFGTDAERIAFWNGQRKKKTA